MICLPHECLHHSSCDEKEEKGSSRCEEEGIGTSVTVKIRNKEASIVMNKIKMVVQDARKKRKKRVPDTRKKIKKDVLSGSG
jgi:hypothetical protein